LIYALSKAFWLVAQPGNLLALLALLGMVLLFTRWRRLGRGIIVLLALLMVVIAALPVGDWLLRPLENSAERFIAFADLARRYPEAKLVYSGGGLSLDDGRFREADAAREVLQWMGMDIGRVIFERQSRNTFENVADSKELVRPAPGETWILITSAYHMPRAVGLFRAQDWPVVPDPVDYRTGTGEMDGGIDIDFTGHLDLLGLGLKEWIGMLANGLLGHSQSYFPGPG